MAIKISTLERHFNALRKIEEHRTAQSERNIRRIYQALLKDLRQFVGVEYATLAEDDKLTYEILQRKGQYARFLEEFERRINNLTPEASTEIKRLVENMYDISYKGMVNAVEKSPNLKDLKEKLENIKNVTPEVVRAAIENPISGLTLSDVLEKNRKEIIYNIKRDVTSGLLSGDRMSSMAKRIANSVDQNYRKSVLIARTEVHRVREAGHHDAATELDGVMQEGTTSLRMVKTWRSMKDERVRKTSKANHRKLDGVSVGMDEEFDLGHGVKAKAPGQSGNAANDCNCRCYLSYDLKEMPKVNSKEKIVFDESVDKNAKRLVEGVAGDFQKDFPVKISVVNSEQGDFTGLNSGAIAYVEPKDNSLHLNPTYFGKGVNFEQAYGGRIRTLHKNASAKSVLYHELSHSLESINGVPQVLEKTVKWFLREANGLKKAALQEAREYGEKATLETVDTSMMSYLPDWQVAAKVVSRYAATTEHELFAEALADWYVNGDKASEFSKKLVSEIRKLLNK